MSEASCVRIASIEQLHDVMITPASDAVFQSPGDPPRNDRGWIAARDQAMVPAEAGNLLLRIRWQP